MVSMSNIRTCERNDIFLSEEEFQLVALALVSEAREVGKPWLVITKWDTNKPLCILMVASLHSSTFYIKREEWQEIKVLNLKVDYPYSFKSFIVSAKPITFRR